MNQQQKQKILAKAKQFFNDKIVSNHLKNISQLKSLSKFNPNPFLDKYLAKLVFGSVSAENIAKALIYPRMMGTSINTTFGTQMQNFCKDVLDGFASTTSGIDIEFVDQIDGKKKYCQIKAGPNTINKDDITTIINHFKDIRNLARTNGLPNFNPDTDCIVGIFYGEDEDLSTMYKTIKQSHPVYAGKEFWRRITGDENFYDDLISKIAEVAAEIETNNVINEAIEALSVEITEKYEL